jgi:hypothetical protein
MLESKYQPLAPVRIYRKRLRKSLLTGIGILFICLFIGILGYHFAAGIPWLDALHNASMILSGMGPVVEIKSTGGKWFSSFYALFSGVVFITNIGLMLTPSIHRFFHKMHLKTEDDKS